MPTLKEKVFSRITEDFQVLAKIVIRQLNLTKQLMDDNHKRRYIQRSTITNGSSTV